MRPLHQHFVVSAWRVAMAKPATAFLIRRPRIPHRLIPRLAISVASLATLSLQCMRSLLRNLLRSLGEFLGELNQFGRSWPGIGSKFERLPSQTRPA
jgi:hypothetical protein